MKVRNIILMRFFLILLFISFANISCVEEKQEVQVGSKDTKKVLLKIVR